jgi:hypothetical protein
MAVSLASFQSVVGQGLKPSELLMQLDKLIAHYTRQTRQNCALICAEITLYAPSSSNERKVKGPTLHVANAGCITPIIKQTDGTVKWIKVGGTPLGVDSDSNFIYEEASLNLSKGDLVILTSDGVAEANNAEGEMFGFERLEQAVVDGPTSSARAMLEHMKVKIATFVGKSEPHDDMTVIVARV